MSKHNRTSRRRRIALGLGATGGGLLAAAFIPMGIALAAPTPDPGLFPTDTETVPDPFTDAYGVATGTTGTLAADQQLNIDNSILAAQLDYDIDNKEPFSFATIDGIPTEPSGYVAPDTGTTTGDLDPFDDAFGTNANDTSYDYALNTLLTPAQVMQLDSIADGSTTTVGGTPTEPTTPDPFLDAVQAVYTTPDASQVAEANYADYLLDTQNATYAAQLDTAVEASIKAGDFSTTQVTPGTDSDAFADAFENAGVSTPLADTEGGAFDSTSDLSQVATQLDPIVDTLGNPAAAPDVDPAADWVQFFDPNAFTTNPFTGLEVPNDFLGTLAVDYDTFINTIPGLAAPYDAFVDSAIASLTSLGL